MYIVATISKNSYSPDKIEEILLAGAEILRFNLSHGTPEESAGKMGVAREVISKLGLEGRVKIMADLPGSKLRLGRFQSLEHPSKKGERHLFKSGAESSDPREFIPVNFPKIGKYVHVGQVVSIGDGELGLKVVEIPDEESFLAESINDRSILAIKALNMGMGVDSLDHFTQATLDHIDNLGVIRPELVAFSFVRSSEDIHKARELLAPHLDKDWQPKIVAKIESPMAVEKIESIAAVADVILVARGDLGLTAPIESLGVHQKRIVKAAKAAGKEVIVSTQILDSLLKYHVPQRAEVLDLTNIVLDGADGIMLAKETGISLTPGDSVKTARAIISAVESAGPDKL